MKKLGWVCALLFTLTGCLGVPEPVVPVQGFDLQRYLGTWYEIARLDHSFERGMEQVTAEYAMREDGGVQVINRGFLPEKNQWKEAEGKAFLVGRPSEGYLKVSFFGPFYGSYVIFHLDKDNYGYAFVCGPDTSYLWLLSRHPTVDEEVLNAFVSTSKALGFNTDELIYVNHASR